MDDSDTWSPELRVALTLASTNKIDTQSVASVEEDVDRDANTNTDTAPGIRGKTSKADNKSGESEGNSNTFYVAAGVVSALFTVAIGIWLVTRIAGRKRKIDERRESNNPAVGLELGDVSEVKRPRNSHDDFQDHLFHMAAALDDDGKPMNLYHLDENFGSKRSGHEERKSFEPLEIGADMNMDEAAFADSASIELEVGDLAPYFDDFSSGEIAMVETDAVTIAASSQSSSSGAKRTPARQRSTTEQTFDGSSAQPSSTGKKAQWTKEQDKQLLAMVKLHGSTKSWGKIAEGVKGRTALQCYGRYTRALNPKIKKSRWTAEEDAILRKLRLESPNLSNRDIAVHIPGRTAAQCFARWNESVNPALRHGPWSADEDALLLQLRDGGEKWVDISKQGVLVGRAQNSLKNRYRKLMRQRKRAMKNASRGAGSAGSADTTPQPVSTGSTPPESPTNLN